MFILLKNALVAPFSRTSDPVYNRLSSSEKPDSIADDIDLEARSHSSSSDEFTDAPVRKSQRVDPRVVSDAIIGLSDGLTVPFALTAGLSTLGDTKVVVYGGVAELVAGAISMGLGGYLGAKSEQESYDSLLRSTQNLVTTHGAAARSASLRGPQNSAASTPSLPSTPTFASSRSTSNHSNPLSESLTAILAPYAAHIPSPTLASLQTSLSSLPAPLLTTFLMEHAHHAPKPAASRPLTCALTIAAGYFFGGLVPLLPYLILCSIPSTTSTIENTTETQRRHQLSALTASIVLTALCLLIFGVVKTLITNSADDEAQSHSNADSTAAYASARLRKERRKRLWAAVGGGLQMLIVGGTAAGAAMAFVSLGRWASAAE